MRHSLYANNRKAIPDNASRFNSFEKATGFTHRGTRQILTGRKDKKTLILESKISKALDCYKDDQDTRIDIIDEYSLYRVNLTFAIWYDDRELEKKLYSDFVRYLDQKIDERRC